MESRFIKSYKDLTVWSKSMDLVILVYKFTDSFPKSETYGLVTQMRRAVVSIPSNIVEGKRRGSRKEFRHFLLNAYESGAELETQIQIAKRLSFGNDTNNIEELLNEVMKMLNRFIFKLQPTT